jgi:hypothetical protein
LDIVTWFDHPLCGFDHFQMRVYLSPLSCKAKRNNAIVIYIPLWPKGITRYEAITENNQCHQGEDILNEKHRQNVNICDKSVKFMPTASCM